MAIEIFKSLERVKYRKGYLQLDYFLGKEYGDYYLFFKWTNPKEVFDMVSNVLLIPFVHIGSLIRALANYRHIKRILDRDKGAEIHIAGYSQGGAAALWFNMFFRKRVKTCNVFGSHRILGITFFWLNRSLDNVIWWEYGKDIVCQLPFGMLRSGQVKHIGPYRFWPSIKDHGGYRTCM